MLTVVAVKPTDDYFEIITNGFEVELKKVGNMGQIDFDLDRPIIIFHPRTHDDNAEWLPPERIEDFMDFDFHVKVRDSPRKKLQSLSGGSITTNSLILPVILSVISPHE